MADHTVWRETEQRILAQLDIAAEYRALGVMFTRDTPTGKGWLACHAMGRKDDTASAAVNVGTGTVRGRYRDMGGEGLSLNLWECAARFGKWPDWRAARKHYAERAGVDLPVGGEPKRPEDQVHFIDTPADTVILEGWAHIKGGFDIGAIRDNGGVYGRYPKKSKPEHSQYVAAFPAYNPPGLTDSDPSAWVIANITNEPVLVFRGKGKEPSKSKTLSVGGSVGGLLGTYALKALMAERDREGPGVEVVWKVEGLSDLLTLHTVISAAGLLGKHIVISNSQGSLESVRPEWVELLAGKVVYVVHDCDRPGETGAGRWVHLLAPRCPIVKEIKLPYQLKDTHGEDIRDFLYRDKRPLADLLAIADETPAWRKSHILAVPPTAPTEETRLFDAAPLADVDAATGTPPEEAAAADILKLIGLEVLGEHSDRSIKVYSHGRRKVDTIPKINFFSFRDLIQLCGRPAQLYIHDGKDSVEGKRTMEEVRRAVALFGGALNLDDHPPRGQGCWRHEDGVLIVNGREAALWQNGQLQPITAPRLGPHLLEYEARDSWVSFDVLRDYLEQSKSATWSEDVWHEAVALFSKWRWTVAADAQVAVGLILASFVQTLFAWRPQVGVMGPSNSGKSTLFEALQSVFDKLALAVQKPTEAAIRQSVDNRACILLLDEFESDAHRTRVLELIRTSSRGGVIARGTSDQRGRRFGLKHIVWTAAIELGLSREADANRFITLRLERPPAEGYGRMNLPGDDDLKTLGVKLLALAVRHAHEAARLAVALKDHVIERVPSRIVESYAVPASMYAAVFRYGEEAADTILRELLLDRAFDGRVVADEHALLDEILQSHVDIGHARRRSVREIITDAEVYSEGASALTRHGISLVAAGTGPRPDHPSKFQSLFINPPTAQRFLLRGTRWGEGDIKEVLLRLRGAEWSRRRVGEKQGDDKKDSRSPGVILPLGLVHAVTNTPQLDMSFTFDDIPDEEPNSSGARVPTATIEVAQHNRRTWEQEKAIENLMTMDLT